MNRSKIPLVTVVLLGGGFTWLTARQFLTIKQLRSEISALNQQITANHATLTPPPPVAPSVTRADSETEHLELLRLRGEVAALRRQSANPSPTEAESTTVTKTNNQADKPLSDQLDEFLQQRPDEQGHQLGSIRNVGAEKSAAWLAQRTAAEKARPALDALEAKPAAFAEFQAAFIQSAVGITDEQRVTQIRQIIQHTYDQAVAAHLDAPSRPEDGIANWVLRRQALDRPATEAVQQLLTPEERVGFDRLFLGVMGIDLGTGDGTWHRFVDGNGTVHFPSEGAGTGDKP